ncbi:MAG: hypothetical protein AB7E24_23280 [Novosphingobium sp.]
MASGFTRDGFGLCQQGLQAITIKRQILSPSRQVCIVQKHFHAPAHARFIEERVIICEFGNVRRVNAVFVAVDPLNKILNGGELPF